MCVAFQYRWDGDGEYLVFGALNPWMQILGVTSSIATVFVVAQDSLLVQ